MIGRKVKIFKWDCGKKVKDSVGIFHQWGSDFEEWEKGTVIFSTAIVEMEDGTIRNVHCEMIQFIK
ncbi:hypothetical protein DRH13_04360 [Candidatus Woesebacteria bacterium]|nr:MAG: hypothetical protein DRH13_04360 [Candidatus Woesebacteria bacterium]